MHKRTVKRADEDGKQEVNRADANEISMEAKATRN